MKFVEKKKILITLFVVIFLGIGYQHLYLVTPIEFKDYGDWLEEKNRSLGEIERYNNALVKAYEEDYDGGKTPEETLSLWVEAIKENDLEKASLYFLVDARTEALKLLKLSKDNGVLPRAIKEIEENGKIIISSDGKGASLDTSIKGDPGFYITFKKNPYTEIWKLEEIF